MLLNVQAVFEGLSHQRATAKRARSMPKAWQHHTP